jgi:NAD+ kinase
MTVFLIPNLRKENAVPTARRAVKKLRACGARVLMPAAVRGCMEEPVEFLEDAEAFGQCDVIVTVGGDGTILHAARRSLGYQKPLLGVNIGRVGFLATVEADELEKLERLVRGGRCSRCPSAGATAFVRPR